MKGFHKFARVFHHSRPTKEKGFSWFNVTFGEHREEVVGIEITDDNGLKLNKIANRWVSYMFSVTACATSIGFLQSLHPVTLTRTADDDFFSRFYKVAPPQLDIC